VKQESSPIDSDEEARRRAVGELGKTFLVEAGAGTGKTSVLVQRLLTVVRTGRAPIERVVAITFTEKAAAELRIRLRAAIETALDTALSDDERRSLYTARSQLDRAPIATIHAFCAMLLRERPVEAGVDPSFTVLDQFAAEFLQRETWQEWLAQEMDRRSQVLKQALRTDLTLVHLETLRDFLIEHRDCLHLLPAPVTWSLSELRVKVTEAYSRLDQLKTLCLNPTDRLLAQIGALEERVPVNAEEIVWERWLCQPLSLNTKSGNKTQWQSPEALTEVRTVLGDIVEAHTRARLAWCHNLTVALAEWLGGYLRAYEEKKNQESTLDFTDLLLATRNLLKHNFEIRRYFQHRFDFLLIDEFQDTDPLQSEIAFFLAEETPRAMDWTAVTLRPGKLFVVGDPRQSIYSFRRADLQIYTQVRAVIERQGEILALSTNFRSRAPVLGWLNETFARVFSGDNPEQPAYRPLTAARYEDTGREVVWLPIPQALLPEKPNRAELRQAEARTVATFLKEVVDHDKLAVWGNRTIQYRDIAILCRTHQAIETYEEVLKNAGVPTRVFGGHSYATRPEVIELRALLKTIEHPADSTALVATLRSSLFGFTDEELAHWIATGGKLDYLRPPACTPASMGFVEAFAVLRDLHTQRTHLSPSALLYDLYTRTHVIPLFALRPKGIQRIANLLKLMDTAQALVARGLPTLRALIRFLDQQDSAAIEGESPLAEEQADAVRLLTIHKAKGLEFPVVVLADATVRSSSRRGRVGVLDRHAGSVELALGPRALTYATQGWQKAEAQEQVREAAEEQRLWYVAAARVRDHLIIPALPPMEKRTAEEPQTFAEDDEEPQSNPFVLATTRKGNVFVYHSNVHQVAKSAPVILTPPVFTIPASNQALQAYQQWDVNRRKALAKGKATKIVCEVSQLAVAHGTSWRMTTPSAVTDYADMRVRAQAAATRLIAAPFSLHEHGCLFEGTIDSAFVENNAWVLVDAASENAVAKTNEEEVQLRLRRLCLVAVALEKITDTPVKQLVLFSAHEQQQPTFAFGGRERAWGIATLATALTTLEPHQ
jgi:ATP-dependent helicase/nuclease subunit A